MKAQRDCPFVIDDYNDKHHKLLYNNKLIAIVPRHIGLNVKIAEILLCYWKDLHDYHNVCKINIVFAPLLGQDIKKLLGIE